jgi:hypothetical protein
MPIQNGSFLTKISSKKKRFLIMQYGYRIVGEGSRNQPHLQKLASPPNYTDHQRK